MERITKREGKHCIRIGNEWRRHDVGWDKLAEYEDLEEKGLLLRLKLKVGDTFWELNDNHLEPYVYPRIAHSLSHVLYCMDKLGKITFLNQEQAEQELAKRNNEIKPRF